MKYFIIAGEKSGDLHAGNLAKELGILDNDCQMQGWGGSEMSESGVELLQRYDEMAFMGLDFIWHLGKIRKLFSNCKNQINQFWPDVLILVDYSGFNLRIAKWAKKNNFKVVYYIAPKTWAWNASRNKTIKKFVDKLLVILPFEETYFREKNIDVEYVGNPLIQHLKAFEPVPDFAEKLPKFEKTVALLPGSRKKEIERSSIELKKLARHFPHSLFVVAGISEVGEDSYDSFECIPNCIVLFDETYDLLHISDAAIVNSGTATLETGLFNVPQIVVYRTGGLTYFIVSKLIKVKYISLVNLILDKNAVPELIQDKFNSGELKTQLKDLLFDTKKREIQFEYYKKLKETLGDLRASEKAAQSIINTLK